MLKRGARAQEQAYTSSDNRGDENLAEIATKVRINR